MAKKNADRILVTTPACAGCGEESEVYVPLAPYHQWVRGVDFAVAFAATPAGEREFILTGKHPAC